MTIGILFVIGQVVLFVIVSVTVWSAATEYDTNSISAYDIRKSRIPSSRGTRVDLQRVDLSRFEHG